MYAVLDIETTGGKYDEEGITEIAIYRFDGEKIIDQFSSLINPEKEIQPFVKKLTGINNNMLRNSPKFYEVAKRIVEITENCIIVAHNAEFDFRMLQTEFRRLSFTFNRKILCTIKLSKILLPDQPSFNLGKLINNLGIPFTNEHRAHGDAKVTLKLFQLLLEKDSKKYILKKNIQNLNPNKTPTKYLGIIDKLPSEMGIYYIHNTNNEIIYIGKSDNIKKRVISHLTGFKEKSLKIQNEISNVSYSLTGGELISLLKEQNEIKLNSPIYNESMKFRLFPIGIRIDFSYDYPNIIVEQVKKDRQYLCVYKNKKTAKTAIFKFINGTINKESISDYRKKINAFCRSFEYQSRNFLLIDKGRQSGEFSFIYIEDNKFLGYGYYELNHQIKTKDQIESRLIPIEDNLDTQKLIRSFILRKKYIKLINLQSKD